MGKLKRAILLNFRTKVIVPVVGVMVLLMATTMWLINQRVTRQVQTDASEQLATADAVLSHVQQMRLDGLLASYRKVESEPLFKAHAALFAPDGEGFSEAAQKTVRNFLNTLIREKFAKVITVVPLDGPRLTLADDAWIKLAEFESTTASLVATAITNGASVGVVRNGEQLLDVVAVPIRLREDVVAAFVFGVEDTLTEEVRELARGEVLLMAGGKAVVSTARARELEAMLPDQIKQAATSGRSKLEKLVLNDEHFLCLGGTLQTANATEPLSYLILSSYEKPLRVLREMQQLILLVSLAAIIVGIAIVWIYVRRVTEPLEDLRAYTEAIGKGDFTRRVELDSRDEFGELAEAFNHMTDNLRFSREQLEKTVDSLKTTQAQLIQSEKLSGIGEFVAGVAHELNNPLTTVMGFSELLQMGDSPPQQKRHLQMIHQSAVRCRKIVQNLLSFSRKHQPERKAVALNKLIEESVEILAYQLRTSGIEIVTEFDAQLPLVLVDQHQMQQVFINIVNNARQAIEENQAKGSIRISTSREGERIKIIFHDNGPGISAENLSKLFDPFFTTKEVGKGTGLGLSICYGIVKEHGGTIVVQSQPGNGAKFIIELPVPPETDRHTANPALETTFVKKGNGHGQTVLVIDDEESILEMVKELLLNSGYQVEAVASAELALSSLKHRKYDLAICDWKMPGLGGQKFYQWLLKLNPTLADRLIFMTGDVVNEQMQKFLADHNKECLAKPFSLKDFENAMTNLQAGVSKH